MLKTAGTKENSYLYTMDAVTAILTLLVKGENGRTYNVANEETYCSVKDMGKLVLNTFGKVNLKVVTNVGNEKNCNAGFRPDGYLNISNKHGNILSYSNIFFSSGFR